MLSMKRIRAPHIVSFQAAALVVLVFAPLHMAKGENVKLISSRLYDADGEWLEHQAVTAGDGVLVVGAVAHPPGTTIVRAQVLLLSAGGELISRVSLPADFVTLRAIGVVDRQTFYVVAERIQYRPELLRVIDGRTEVVVDKLTADARDLAVRGLALGPDREVLVLAEDDDGPIAIERDLRGRSRELRLAAPGRGAMVGGAALGSGRALVIGTRSGTEGEGSIELLAEGKSKTRTQSFAGVPISAVVSTNAVSVVLTNQAGNGGTGFNVYRFGPSLELLRTSQIPARNDLQPQSVVITDRGATAVVGGLDGQPWFGLINESGQWVEEWSASRELRAAKYDAAFLPGRIFSISTVFDEKEEKNRVRMAVQKVRVLTFEIVDSSEKAVEKP